MLLIKVILVIFIIENGLGQVTKVAKQNPFLSRKKRYLKFPMKSNLVYTLSLTKPLLRVQPRGYNLLLECDIPFELPSDTRLFKGIKRNHFLQRREILTKLEDAFDSNGLNGLACVKRMICESQLYADMKEKSLVKDILSALFMSDNNSKINIDKKYQNSCHSSTFSECAIPILNYILGSLKGVD